MNCRRAQRALDDFLDGGLAAARRRAVERHLEECSACRAAERDLRTLLARAAVMPRSLEPAGDLWPAIAARIAQPGERPARLTSPTRAPHHLRLALAAAAVVLVVVSSLATRALIGRRAAQRLAQGPPAWSAATAALPSRGLADAQATYAAAREHLLAALATRRSSLSPQTLAVVDRNLKIIDRAVAEMQAALARDPENRELPGLLMTAYAQEIDLLQVAVGLPGRA
jgi:predicted anti-sigma-YlaC factor YlaD